MAYLLLGSLPGTLSSPLFSCGGRFILSLTVSVRIGKGIGSQNFFQIFFHVLQATLDSQLIAYPICFFWRNLSGIEGLTDLIAYHIRTLLLFPACHGLVAGLCQKKLGGLPWPGCTHRKICISRPPSFQDFSHSPDNHKWPRLYFLLRWRGVAAR